MVPRRARWDLAAGQPELAWALSERADMLAKADDVKDRSRAASMREEDLRAATALGMKPLIEILVSKRPMLKA